LAVSACLQLFWSCIYEPYHGFHHAPWSPETQPTLNVRPCADISETFLPISMPVML